MANPSLAHAVQPIPTPDTAEERHLRALEDRYPNELMDDQERLELRDHILKLTREL